MQVEATKFTEVGFHGRDVDSIVRDLLDNAALLVRGKLRERAASKVRGHGAPERRLRHTRMRGFFRRIGQGLQVCGFERGDVWGSLRRSVRGVIMQLFGVVWDGARARGKSGAQLALVALGVGPAAGQKRGGLVRAGASVCALHGKRPRGCRANNSTSRRGRALAIRAFWTVPPCPALVRLDERRARGAWGWQWCFWRRELHPPS
jgi:hypothetical protein